MDKLDIDKLVPVPVDLSKLSSVIKNDVAKKTVYDKLVAKVNSIDTSAFVLKTYDTDKKYDTDKTELEKKISDTSGLVKKTDYNAKITEIEGKIPSTSGLAKNAALTAVENKIPNINSLVRETDYDTKITGTEKKLTDHNHDKYIATQKLLKLKRNLLIIIMINILLLQSLTV